MLRMIPVGAILVVYIGGASCLYGQTPESRPDSRLDDAVKRLDDAVQEIALLKRTVADQDRRMANLERTVRSLQTTVLAASRRVPASWRTAEGWAAVKLGMSRDQVVEILGEPKSAEAVIDRQTLYYRDATEPVGKVVLTDDRVSEIDSQRFQIYVPSQK
jgi:hypothetical protein